MRIVFLLMLLLASPAYAAPVKVFINSGTGFIVGGDGYAITNLHVVSQCQRIILAGAVAPQPARIAARNREDDLALLKIDGHAPETAYLRSADQPVAAGEEMVIYGYPGQSGMRGQGVMREARVVDPKGPRGEAKWIQLSDVVEQGNSGGPLIDRSGHVAGVISAQAEISRFSPLLPQQPVVRRAGIALSLEVLKAFLDGQGVRYREAGLGDGGYSAERAAETARRFIVHVRCEQDVEMR